MIFLEKINYTNYKPRISLVKIGEGVSKVNSLLLMTPLYTQLGILGRSMTQRAICAFPMRKEAFREEIEEEETSFDAVRQLVQRETAQFTPLDTLIVTSSLGLKMLGYGGFCLGIGACPIPLSEWHFLAIFLGPWWSGSQWSEWVCYDFFRSAFAENPDEKKGLLTQWFPFHYHPEVRLAYRHHKASFYLSALALLALYVFVYQVRPSTTPVLLQKMGLDPNSFSAISSHIRDHFNSQPAEDKSHDERWDP